jgi:hypothetical protein
MNLRHIQINVADDLSSCLTTEKIYSLRYYQLL